MSPERGKTLKVADDNIHELIMCTSLYTVTSLTILQVICCISVHVLRKYEYNMLCIYCLGS